MFFVTPEGGGGGPRRPLPRAACEIRALLARFGVGMKRRVLVLARDVRVAGEGCGDALTLACLRRPNSRVSSGQYQICELGMSDTRSVCPVHLVGSVRFGMAFHIPFIFGIVSCGYTKTAIKWPKPNQIHN